MCAGPGILGMLVILAVVIGAVCFIVMSLIRLGHAKLDEIPRFLWALLILGFPIVGSLAFFLVAPGRGE
ncbi:MAG: hypothetical protein ABII20_03975 [Candidatus Omnitrophota bacterium]|nr:hypothetical protein [Candidatus Omnitrophota bacterium]MBU2528890.1 hypothetical protein [bacterium]MBU3929999.1 hypothetical protein [bacterium]MBU4122953.1 hypothetical protein [bacterium]